MRVALHTLAVDADISLVPRHPADAAEFYAIVERHRTALQEWLTWLDATRSVADVRRYAQFAEAQFEQHAAFDYAIRYRGTLCGSMGLHNIDWTSRTAHAGYWISPEFRGLGIVTRAVARLTTLALTRLELHRLEIRVVTENEKSRAVAERLGYRFEGILREAYALQGRFRDLALYAMLAGEWSADR